MDRNLGGAALLLSMLAALCAGAGCSPGDREYDGPGKELIGDWDTDVSLAFVLDGFSGSSGGFTRVSIAADGDQLLVEDDECAYPAQGNGADGLSFLPDDGCVSTSLVGDPVRFRTSTGTGSMNGSFITLELSGALEPLDGSPGGTFTLVHRGERSSGGGGGGSGGSGDGVRSAGSADPG